MKYLVNGPSIPSAVFDSKEAAEKSWELTFETEDRLQRVVFDWNEDQSFCRVYRSIRVFREKERIGSICQIEICSEPKNLRL